MADLRVEAFIFARGGSKGVPRKNLKLLAGKPLIAHAIGCAKDCPSLGHVNVSTEDEEIAAIARAWGADVPFVRPAALAMDNSPEWAAWQHAVETMTDQGRPFDILVSLPPTSPFRSVEDVEACIKILRDRPDIDVALTVRESDRSPYFNMVQIKTDGVAEIVIKGDSRFHRRQDVPKVYDITTVAYAIRSSLILKGNGLFDGRVFGVEVPAERALDIDTPYDFLIAELLATHQGLEGEGI
jgi:CMP-N-acetylneuraminic acid synthetase